MQSDPSDCLLWWAFEVWPIRLFVLHTLWKFRVTQALLGHASYLFIWSGHTRTSYEICNYEQRMQQIDISDPLLLVIFILLFYIVCFWGHSSDCYPIGFCHHLSIYLFIRLTLRGTGTVAGGGSLPRGKSLSCGPFLLIHFGLNRLRETKQNKRQDWLRSQTNFRNYD